jgi:tetratricopeptide (TPR) repeat protein
MKHSLHTLAFAVVAAATTLAAAPARSAEPQPPMATMETLPRDARLALFNAQQHLEKGEIDKAADELAKYVRDHDKKKDDSFLMHYQLAGMLVQADRRDEALAQYERCVVLEPRYAPGWIGVGETAYGLANYKRAAEALQAGYERMDEKRPDVLYYAAVARVQSGDAAGALPLLEELTAGKIGEPKFEWYRGLVSACLQVEDKERGARAVTSMLDRFSTQADTWYLAFQYYASVSDYRQAAIALTMTGYLRPLTRQEEIQLGDLYSAIEAPAAAADRYATALSDSAGPREIERMASAYLASHQPEAALEVLERGIKREPTFRLWSLLGDLHVMEDRFGPAYSAFEEASRLDPKQTRPHLMMGYCAIELNRTDDALAQLAIAAADDEYAERAQVLIRRAQQLARTTP